MDTFSHEPFAERLEILTDVLILPNFGRLACPEPEISYRIDLFETVHWNLRLLYRKKALGH